jgi:O-glycosyl hydrolase
MTVDQLYQLFHVLLLSLLAADVTKKAAATAEAAANTRVRNNKHNSTFYPIYLRHVDFTYDGHGALSAGASSRLLYDYPIKQRDEILDYLFTPNFGASLDLLKVEIGGDSQSTDGTEASHAHYREDLNCHRGYEWWLLEEATKRNPDIILYALSWAVPKWIGNDTYYSEDNIQYHLSWLKCARDEHPTIGNIDYIGK